MLRLVDGSGPWPDRLDLEGLAVGDEEMLVGAVPLMAFAASAPSVTLACATKAPSVTLRLRIANRASGQQSVRLLLVGEARRSAAPHLAHP